MGNDGMRGHAFSILKGAASIAAAAVLVLSVSLAIAWPLWSLATGNRRAYTIIVGAVAGLGAALGIARALRARYLRSRSPAGTGRGSP